MRPTSIENISTMLCHDDPAFSLPYLSDRDIGERTCTWVCRCIGCTNKTKAAVEMGGGGNLNQREPPGDTVLHEPVRVTYRAADCVPHTVNCGS